MEKRLSHTINIEETPKKDRKKGGKKYRGVSLEDVAAAGTPFEAAGDERLAAMAMGLDHTDEVLTDDWKLPAGAFKKQGGSGTELREKLSNWYWGHVERYLAQGYLERYAGNCEDARVSDHPQPATSDKQPGEQMLHNRAHNQLVRYAIGGGRFEEHQHPRDQGGQFTSGAGSAAQGDDSRTVNLKGQEFEVKQDRGLWFWRRPGGKAWMNASDEMVDAVQDRLKEQPAKPKKEKQPGGEGAAAMDTSVYTERISRLEDQVKRLKAGGSGDFEDFPARMMPMGELSSDPQRFQYKVEDIGEEGVTATHKDVSWSPMLGGMIYAWKDPADGKTYVINGHHRFEIAKRSGYSGPIPTFLLEAKDPKEARALGAIINIAEGHGTALDAAKFMRDTGKPGEEGIKYLKSHHVSLKGKIAADSIKLSNLSDNLFRELTYGRLDENHAKAIGTHLKITSEMDKDSRHATWDAQNRILKDIQGKPGVPAKVVNEMALNEALATEGQKEQGSLFGELSGGKERLGLERAVVQSAIRSALSRDAAAFGAVTVKGRAGKLAEAGVGDVSAEKAEEEKGKATNILDDFKREIKYKSKVSDRMNQAAKEFKDAKNKAQRAKILEQAEGDIRELVQAAATARRQGPGFDTETGESERPGRETLVSSPGQKSIFRKPGKSVNYGLIAQMRYYDGLHGP